MATHSPLAGALTDLDAVIAEAPEEATGALWRLTGTTRVLDANLIRLAPGAAIAEHREPLLDVLLVVIEGTGRLDTEDGPQQLRPHTAALLARNTSRSLTAGPQGMAYLTVHPRRPGLGITGAGPRAGATGAAEAAGGGEPACLLGRVCPDCGRLAAEADARYCSRCGGPLPE